MSEEIDVWEENIPMVCSGTTSFLGKVIKRILEVLYDDSGIEAIKELGWLKVENGESKTIQVSLKINDVDVPFAEFLRHLEPTLETKVAEHARSLISSNFSELSELLDVWKTQVGSAIVKRDLSDKPRAGVRFCDCPKEVFIPGLQVQDSRTGRTGFLGSQESYDNKLWVAIKMKTGVEKIVIDYETGWMILKDQELN